MERGLFLFIATTSWSSIRHLENGAKVYDGVTDELITTNGSYIRK